MTNRYPDGYDNRRDDRRRGAYEDRPSGGRRDAYGNGRAVRGGGRGMPSARDVPYRGEHDPRYEEPDQYATRRDGYGGYDGYRGEGSAFDGRRDVYDRPGAGARGGPRRDSGRRGTREPGVPERRRGKRRGGRWGLPVVAAVVVILAAGGVAARETGSLRFLDKARTTGTSAGPKTITGGPGTTTTQDWEGTGLTAIALDPSHFAQGACTEFVPGGGAARDETVFIDAGHGGIDPGGTGETSSGAEVTESVINLAVTLDAMKILTSEGYTVVVSRTEQTTVLKLESGDTDEGLLSVTGVEQDLAARDQCANMAHANLLVGIYMNAGAADEAGSVTIYDDARPFAADNIKFADLLQADVLADLNAHGYQIPNGGVNNDAGYGSTTSQAGASYGHLELLGPSYPADGFTTPSEMPGALIEPLFLTDPFEATIADSSSGQQLIAEGVSRSAEQYFAETAKSTAKASAPASS
jgi:N-acetylmuramoyl-L-alanine amidase